MLDNLVHGVEEVGMSSLRQDLDYDLDMGQDDNTVHSMRLRSELRNALSSTMLPTAADCTAQSHLTLAVWLTPAA